MREEKGNHKGCNSVYDCIVFDATSMLYCRGGGRLFIGEQSPYCLGPCKPYLYIAPQHMWVPMLKSSEPILNDSKALRGRRLCRAADT